MPRFYLLRYFCNLCKNKKVLALVGINSQPEHAEPPINFALGCNSLGLQYLNDEIRVRPGLAAECWEKLFLRQEGRAALLAPPGARFTINLLSDLTAVHQNSCQATLVLTPLCWMCPHAAGDVTWALLLPSSWEETSRGIWIMPQRRALSSDPAQPPSVLLRHLDATLAILEADCENSRFFACLVYPRFPCGKFGSWKLSVNWPEVKSFFKHSLGSSHVQTQMLLQ